MLFAFVGKKEEAANNAVVVVVGIFRFFVEKKMTMMILGYGD